MWILWLTMIATGPQGNVAYLSQAQAGQFASATICQAAGNAWLGTLTTLPNGVKLPSVVAAELANSSFVCTQAQ